MRADLWDRFAVKIDFGDCWTWTSALDGSGYAQFWMNGSTVKAHRWLYEQAVETIPTGMQLDHLCRNRRCVNPDHLEVVTQRENIRRGHSANRNKEACANGHPFTEANTYLRPTGGRACLTCKKAALRAWRARQKSLTSTTPGREN